MATTTDTELPTISSVDLLASLASEHERARDRWALSAPVSIERIALAVTKTWPKAKRIQALRVVTGGHPYLNAVVKLLAN